MEQMSYLDLSVLTLPMCPNELTYMEESSKSLSLKLRTSTYINHVCDFNQCFPTTYFKSLSRYSSKAPWKTVSFFLQSIKLLAIIFDDGLVFM